MCICVAGKRLYIFFTYVSFFILGVAFDADTCIACFVELSVCICVTGKRFCRISRIGRFCRICRISRLCRFIRRFIGRLIGRLISRFGRFGRVGGFGLGSACAFIPACAVVLAESVSAGIVGADLGAFDSAAVAYFAFVNGFVAAFSSRFIRISRICRFISRFVCRFYDILVCYFFIGKFFICFFVASAGCHEHHEQHRKS